MSDAGTKSEDSKRVPMDVEDGKKDKPEGITKKNLIGVWLVIMSVCIDVLGSSIVQPVLPFYAKEFGADGQKLGYLYTGFTAMSIISTYVMSLASDRVGRRICILVSIVGSLTYFIWMGFVNSYTELLLARIYGGMTSGSFTVAQAYIVDAVPRHQQGQYFVYLSGTLIAMYMVGPLLGGALVTSAASMGQKESLRVPYYFSACLAAITFCFAFTKLHDTPKDEDAELKEKLNDGLDEFDENETQTEPHPDAEKVPCTVYGVGLIGMLHGAGFSVFGSMGTLFLLEKFGMSTLDISLVVLSSAFVYATSLMVLYGRIKGKIGEYYAAACGSLFVSLGCLVIGLLGSSEAEKWLTILAISLLFFMGNGWFSPAFPSINAHFAGEHNRGQVLATGNSMRELSGVWGPIVFGVLYDVDPEYPWLVAAGVCILACVPMSYLGMQHVPEEDLTAIKKKLDSVTHDDEAVGYNNAPAFTTGKYDEDDVLYMRLGKDVAKILSDKGQPWVYKNAYPYILKNIDNAIIHFPRWLLADAENKYWPDFRKFWQGQAQERVQELSLELEEMLEARVHHHEPAALHEVAVRG